MSSLKSITSHLKPRRGFTMIEMIIVMTIFAVAVASTLPLLSAYKQKQNLPTLTTELIQTLRRAQGRALSGTNGLPWGVAIIRDDTEGATADSFVMFAGDLSPTFEKYQETHEAKRPFRICTDKADGQIVFPSDIRIENNENYFIEIYSMDDEFEKTYILINTAGTIEQSKTYNETCNPTF